MGLSAAATILPAPALQLPFGTILRTWLFALKFYLHRELFSSRKNYYFGRKLGAD